MHIVIAGFGNMGQALVRGWLASSELNATISVVDPNPAARQAAADSGLAAVSAADQLGEAIDVAVLAVKPAELDRVLEALPAARLYLSIAAGRSISEIAGVVGQNAAIVRAMPNTPAAIGQGVTGLCANAQVRPDDRRAAELLMSAAGQVEWIKDESDMDAVTAISGSGPAYVFLLIECLTAAAIEAGLEADLAERLAVATVRGAGAYADAADDDAASLRRQVTSPGGTTEAALSVLMDDDGLDQLIRRAVRKAVARSRELGSR